MSLFELFFFFFRISSVTFGGGVAILGMVQLEEEKRKNIDQEKFTNMISLAASMPGSLAVSISWLMGKHHKGVIGGLVAVLGTILPPFLIVLFASPFILKYSDVPQVQGFFRGVLAATAAIITIVVFSNVKETLTSKLWNFVPYMLIIILIGLFQLHPLLAMALVFIFQLIKEKTVSE